jgi:hypothetical protein
VFSMRVFLFLLNVAAVCITLNDCLMNVLHGVKKCDRLFLATP